MSGILDRLDQQFHELLRTFDVVEWSLSSVPHARTSRAFLRLARRAAFCPSTHEKGLTLSGEPYLGDKAY